MLSCLLNLDLNLHVTFIDHSWFYLKLADTLSELDVLTKA